MRVYGLSSECCGKNRNDVGDNGKASGDRNDSNDVLEQNWFGFKTK